MKKNKIHTPEVLSENRSKKRGKNIILPKAFCFSSTKTFSWCLTESFVGKQQLPLLLIKKRLNADNNTKQRAENTTCGCDRVVWVRVCVCVLGECFGVKPTHTRTQNTNQCLRPKTTRHDSFWGFDRTTVAWREVLVGRLWCNFGGFQVFAMVGISQKPKTFSNFFCFYCLIFQGRKNSSIILRQKTNDTVVCMIVSITAFPNYADKKNRNS